MEGETPDPHLSDITVLNLLQHLGGWDRGTTFDPMFHDAHISDDMNIPLPISKSDITTYMTGKPLQYTPGTTYAYSNYGYCLLGQIIEAITGQSYPSYLAKTIFYPLDMGKMILGRTLPEFRLYDEVKYHSQYDGPSVFRESGPFVPMPYGGWNLENMDSHGGWLASAIDIVRFASTFDNPDSSPVLDSTHVDIMFGLPENIDPDDYNPGDYYYACGWAVRDWGNGVRNTWHFGSLDGTYTLVVRRWDGLNWCALFNQRDDPSGLSYDDIDYLLHEAADAVTTWPEHDLFDEYLMDERLYLPFVSK